MRIGKLVLIVLLIFLSFGGSYGQNIQKHLEKYNDWKKGVLFLKNGKSEKHYFSYNPLVTEGLVQVKSDGKLYTLTVKDIDGFEFYDSVKMVKRKFMVFPIYSTYSKISREYFLEIIYESAVISIVTKSTMVFNNSVSTPENRTV